MKNLRRFLDLLGNFFKKSIHFFYVKLIRPKSDDEDEQRKEYILNIILVGSIILLLWSDLHILIASLTSGPLYLREHTIPFSLFTIIVAAFFGLYALSRNGHSRIAAYLLVLVYLAGVSYGIYRWGFDLPAGLLSLGLIIVTASILVSSRFGFIVASLIVAALLALGYISNRVLDISPWKLQVATATDAVQYGIILFLIAMISWISNREIEKSLTRARASEKELRKERDALEERVEERTKELKQAQIEKVSQLYRFAEFGRLSSGLFHDLINPLTAVALNVSKLNERVSPEVPEIQNYVSKAVAASKRMENFMEAVRKQLQTQEMSTRFSLNTEIEQATELLSYKARQASVAVTFVADKEVLAYGNPIKFNQMMTNLVSNAIDAYKGLDIEKSKRTVLIRMREENDRVHISVSDKGCGIAPEIAEKIFDPFFTTKQKHQGTGLGLSTTKAITEKEFGGRITLESTPSKGSTFSIVFTIAQSSNSGNHTPTP